jgi:signal transduction histidine kinase
VKIKWPSAAAALTALLVILLPVLAFMQYRWVGQVSEGERERMERNLQTAAGQFRRSFENEITRAVLELEAGATTAQEGSSDQYSERYTRWMSSTDHPQIVANIFLVDGADDRLRLRRWNSATHVFELSYWPEPLDRWRPQFEQAYELARAQRAPDLRGFTGEESLFLRELRTFRNFRPGSRVQPPTAPPFGFTVVQLDMAYIRGEMIRTLAEQHFTNPGDDSYRVAVTGGDDPKRVLYRSDPSVSIDATNADVIQPLMLRGSAFRGPQTGNRARNAPEVSNADVPARWRLYVQHEAGSLDAAVGTIRRRNLAISSGVLLLLTFAVVMLTATTRRSERLAQQQMEFVAGVSHELRTPVAVVRSAAENLSSGVVSGDRVKRYGQMIEAEARRLGDMVERVLQYAGIESGFNTAARVPLAPMEIIESAVDSALPLVGPGEVTVHREIAPDLPMVIGDATALRSAVQNLVANAVKYGGRDRWVGIRAQHVRERRRSEVRITVSDHGAGIPAADLPHIFEPFYRGADAVERQIQGHGLGLSLVRRIVVAHGGNVTVSTRPGAGTTFTITLPAAAADTSTNPVGTEMRAGAHS